MRHIMFQFQLSLVSMTLLFTAFGCNAPDLGARVQGVTCASAKDCESGVCLNGVCQPSRCDDTVKNGNESDTDCGGGTCSACSDGRVCKMADDCLSRQCLNGRCVATPCSNGRKDGQETDVDCGGATCQKCRDGRSCITGSDCWSGSCLNNACVSLADGGILPIVDMASASGTDMATAPATDMAQTPQQDMATAPVTDMAQAPQDMANTPQADQARVSDMVQQQVPDGGLRANGQACAQDGDCLSDACDTGLNPPICRPALVTRPDRTGFANQGYCSPGRVLRLIGFDDGGNRVLGSPSGPNTDGKLVMFTNNRWQGHAVVTFECDGLIFTLQAALNGKAAFDTGLFRSVLRDGRDISREGTLVPDAGLPRGVARVCADRLNGDMRSKLMIPIDDQQPGCP